MQLRTVHLKSEITDIPQKIIVCQHLFFHEKEITIRFNRQCRIAPAVSRNRDPALGHTDRLLYADIILHRKIFNSLLFIDFYQKFIPLVFESPR